MPLFNAEDHSWSVVIINEDKGSIVMDMAAGPPCF